MKRQIAHGTNDTEALDVFVKCPQIFLMRLSDECFHTEISGGRKILWCGASAEDLAIIAATAYADRTEDIVVSSVDMHWFMDKWAQDPTVEIAFSWNIGLEDDDIGPPNIAPLTRRGVLQHIVDVAEDDKEGWEKSRDHALSGCESLNLFGVLVPEYTEAMDISAFNRYVYSDGKSGLRYLRWIKDSDLMDKYASEYPSLCHIYKNIPDIIQALERHGLGGLVVERMDSLAVLTVDDLWNMLQANREHPLLASLTDLDRSQADSIICDWLDFVEVLTFSDCGFNLHTTQGANVGALLMYCIADNYLICNPDRQKSYQKLKALYLKKDIQCFLYNLILLADNIMGRDKSLPTDTRSSIHLAARLAMTHKTCDLDGCGRLDMSVGIPFFEESCRFFRQATLELYADMMKQGMLHLGDSDEDIQYYVGYAKSHMPHLMNEWAAAIATATPRKNNLTSVKGYNIHDALSRGNRDAVYFSMGRALHDGYKLLIQLHRGEIVFETPTTSPQESDTETIYVQMPTFEEEQAAQKKVSYIPLSSEKAREGYLYDLDEVLSGADAAIILDEMPHNKHNNDSICTYITSSNEYVVFRVIDMKRAERSLYVYLLTADVPYSAEDANECLLHFYAHPDILLEVGMDIMNARTTNPVTVAGYTARSLQNNTSMTYIETYLCLMTLRENPEKAIKLINEKWKEG